MSEKVHNINSTFMESLVNYWNENSKISLLGAEYDPENDALKDLKEEILDGDDSNHNDENKFPEILVDQID